MKKRILLIALFLCSCSNQKDRLYQSHLSLLKDSNFQTTNEAIFNIMGTSTNHMDKHKIQISFLNPIKDFKDITIMMLADHNLNVSNAPINLGYYNEEIINFVPIKKNEGDQTKIRFTFLSDLEKPNMRIVFSYLEEEREEKLFYFNQFVIAED